MKLNDESKFLIGIAVFTLLLIGASYFFLNRPAGPVVPVDRAILVPADNRLEKGNATASAYLVEFSDYECPACAAFEPTVRELTGKYADKLHFVYRDFPLDQHPMSVPAAAAARAASYQGKFWEMHALLFENQTALSEPVIASLAAQLSLNPDQFNNDRNSAKITEFIEKDRADGLRAKVNATPTFFLNGQKLELNTPEDLIKKLEETLK